jgi:hypothetical protein
MSIVDLEGTMRSKLRAAPQPGWPQPLTLEDELSSALGHLNKARDRKLVAQHLGWDGGLPCSLMQAGARFQLTRERARQVFAASLPLLRRYRGLSALPSVLAYASKRQKEPAAQVEQDLLRLGLTRGGIYLEGALTAAHVFRYVPGFEIEELGGVRFIGTVSHAGKVILFEAAKFVAHAGAIRVSELRRRLPKPHSAIEERLLRSILQTRADLVWLDPNSEWFWLSSVPRNRLVARIAKVLAVRRRVPVSILHHAVSRDYKPIRVPEPVLRSLCSRLPGCRVGRQHVEAHSRPAVEHVLTGAEAKLHQILLSRGGVVRVAALQDLCLEHGVQKANFWRLLRYSPIIRRFGPQVYGLIGAA